MTDAPQTAPVPDGQVRLAGPVPLMRVLAGTTAAGLLLGLLIGGVGSRLAMRALFLTSGSSVRGMISDDGFAIGRFSVTATLNLLLVGTLIGLVGAFVYLAVRPFLIGPFWLRRLTCALGAGAVIGAMLVHTDGVDFTRLGPTWFAIALFVALPAVFGFFAPPAVERAIRAEGWFATAPAHLALLPLAAFVLPPVFVLLALPTAVVVAGRRGLRAWPRFRDIAIRPVTMWVVRAGWLAVAIAGVVLLTRDVTALV